MALILNNSGNIILGANLCVKNYDNLCPMLSLFRMDKSKCGGGGGDDEVHRIRLEHKIERDLNCSLKEHLQLTVFHKLQQVLFQSRISVLT